MLLAALVALGRKAGQEANALGFPILLFVSLTTSYSGGKLLLSWGINNVFRLALLFVQTSFHPRWSTSILKHS